MRRLLVLPLAVALCLGGCATIPAPAPETVAKVATRYDQARSFAELLLPYLPAARQVQVRAALAVTDRAAFALRAAVTAAEQRQALQRMDEALGELDAIVDRPDPPPS